MRQRRHILTLLCAYTLLLECIPTDTRSNYCTDGFCLECQSGGNPYPNKKYCLECFLSNIESIGEDFIYQGGKCTGTMPIENCMSVILGDSEEEGPPEALCRQCRPGFKNTSDSKCGPIGIENCLLTDFFEICVSCLKGFFPSNDGLKCDPTTTKIPNCSSFTRNEEGKPQCYDCEFRYMSDGNECVPRPIEGPSDACKNPMNFTPEDGDAEANCTSGGCNFFGGFFSSDIVQNQFERVLLDGPDGGESFQVCTKNADFTVPFDPSKYWPEPANKTSWARIGIDNLLILFILYAVFTQ